MYRLPRAVLTQILAVRRKKEQGLPVDDGTEGWMLELVELMEMQVRHSVLGRPLRSRLRACCLGAQAESEAMEAEEEVVRAQLAAGEGIELLPDDDEYDDDGGGFAWQQ